MSITEDTYLPSEGELTVDEVNVSTPVLRAAALHLGKTCEFENNEFVLCRRETKDARACIEEGKAVTACTLNFFRQIKKTCYGEFMQYVNCIDKSSSALSLTPCRKTQGVYDKCVKDNLGIERPPADYFAKVQVHKAKRALPPVEEKPVYLDKTPYLPEGTEKPPAKYGARFHWMW